ncbi:MAG: hypothetical protein M3R17_04495 [Bacteroidota bacterium]|nr:hypothetical protein [Bacteroidota bacterium]
MLCQHIEREQLKEIIDYLIKLKLIIQQGEIYFYSNDDKPLRGAFSPSENEMPEG